MRRLFVLIALILEFLLTGFQLLAQSVMVSVDVSGRNLKTSKMSIPEYDFSESGVIVVSIEINQDGKVLSANPGAEGTTLMSALLWSKCRKVALNLVFEEKNNDKDAQHGTVTFVFFENTISEVESPGRFSTNPLAGSDLPDSVSLIDDPIEFQGARKFKVFQIIAEDGALVQSEDAEYGGRYGVPIVLLISNQPNMYFDDQVVTVGVRQKAIQLGTYRYETQRGILKIVPIVMIVDKERKK